MKRQAKTVWISGAVLAALAAGCGTQLPAKSNVSQTEAQAKQKLQLSADVNNQVRQEITAIRDRIRPIENTLRDVSGLFDTVKSEKVPELSGPVRFHSLLENVRKSIEKALGDKLQVNDDGSWKLEDRLTVDNARGEEPLDVKLELTGEHNQSAGDVMNVTLIDSKAKRLELAAFEVKDGHVEATFNPDQLEALIESEIKIESPNCTLVIQKEQSSFECRTMSITKGDYTGVISDLAIHAEGKEVVDGGATLELFKRQDTDVKPLKTIKIHYKKGETLKPEIEVENG
jgi:hypothetical protein